MGGLTPFRHTGEIGGLGLCCRAGIGRAGPQAGGAGRAVLAQACSFGGGGYPGLVGHTGAVAQAASYRAAFGVIGALVILIGAGWLAGGWLRQKPSAA